MDRFRRDRGRALSAAVVGLGYWGPNVLRGLLEQPAVDVSYICDLDEECLGAFARQSSAREAHDPLQGPAGRSGSAKELVESPPLWDGRAAERVADVVCGTASYSAPPVRSPSAPLRSRIVDA